MSRLPAGIVRSLRRLKGLHQRLSLCRVTLAPGCDGRLSGIDDRSLIAELAEDGALVAIFIHPPGIDDDAAALGIATRLQQALQPSLLQQGPSKQGHVPLGAVRVAVLHCDAAALDGSDATGDALIDLPARPLLSLNILPRVVPA